MMRRSNVHSVYLEFGGGGWSGLFLHITARRKFSFHGIRQNLSSEVAREPFYNFPCAGLTAREDSGQRREEEYAEEDRDGKIHS